MLKFSGLVIPFVVVWSMVGCGPGSEKAVPQRGSDPVASFLKEHNLQGRVVLVEFGTVGCELSGKGLDAMIDVSKRSAIPGLALVRLEPMPDKKAFDAYYGPKSLPFPVVRDTQMVLARALGTTVYPQFALLDKFGRVRYRGSAPSEKDLAEWTRTLMSEAKDPGPDAPMFGASKLDAAALLSTTKLPDLSGATRPLASYKGKSGLLLAFVDTKCPFSNVAIREFPKVAPVLLEKGVASLLVNIGEPLAEVKKAYAANASVIYDAGKQTQKCWNVQSVPTIVLLDSAGAVAYQGGAVWADVARATEKMLNLTAGSIALQALSTPQG